MATMAAFNDESHSPIMSLPTEILLIIFDIAHDMIPFPAAVHLAFVCRTWMDVLALRPLLWKSLIITIDGLTFVPDVIKTFFVASRDQRIDVSIVAIDKDVCTLTAEQEQERMNFIMRQVSPHLGRLTKLSIVAFYRSTVVQISRFLDGADMPHLSTLHLVSRNTDVTTSLEISDLKCPALCELYTDAASFMDLVEGARINWPADDGTFRLRLTKYRPPERQDVIAAVGLLKNLSGFRETGNLELYIEDIEFDFYSDETSPGHDVALTNVSWLKLHNLKDPFVSLICGSIRSAGVSLEVHISQCETTPQGLDERMRMPGNELHLTGVTCGVSMLRMLQGFRGRNVTIENCPGFEDWVLCAMALSGERVKRPTRPSMTSLEINGCTFSPDALKRMCNSARIRKMRVRDLPPLCEDLSMWFGDCIENFSWLDYST